MDASGTPVRQWSCGRAPGQGPRNANWPPRWVAGVWWLEKGTQRVLNSRHVTGDALPGTSTRFVKREHWFNADDRKGVTCLHDTQPLGACLHASGSGGRQGHAPRPSTQAAGPLLLAPSPSGEGWGAGRAPWLPLPGESYRAPRTGRAHRRSLGWAVGLVSPPTLIPRKSPAVTHLYILGPVRPRGVVISTSDLCPPSAQERGLSLNMWMAPLGNAN